MPLSHTPTVSICFKMVNRGEFSPDPSRRPDENYLSAGVSIIVASSSDSEEEEEISYEGYEVLPQEFVETGNAEVDDSDSQSASSEEETDININLSNIREPPSFDKSTKSELTELWDSKNNSQVDIVIDSTKEEQIKNAMAGFQLPSTAIPSWAAHVPEEEWKEQLKNRIALFNKVPAN